MITICVRIVDYKNSLNECRLAMYGETFLWKLVTWTGAKPMLLPRGGMIHRCRGGGN